MRILFSSKMRRSALALAPVLALGLMGMRPGFGQTFEVLYTFTGGADGATPFASPILYNGSLYGTASGGGSHESGVVYAFNVTTHKETVLHSFAGLADGSDPVAGLVQKPGANFYGVAYKGGAHNKGTMFEISPAGTFTLLHSFAGPPSDGQGPAGTLVQDTAGDLFGTTYQGGNQKGWGTVFEYAANGTYTMGQSFSPDGALPRAGLFYENGLLYGTTCGGGAHQYGGTIYQVDVQAALYTFTGSTDGSQPLASLIGDGIGNLYGTASSGGSATLGLGDGVIFKFSLTTGQLTVLHTFTGPDGSSPESPLFRDSEGNFYGTTVQGGASGFGTVYKLDTFGNFTTIYSFTGGADGGRPYGGVIVDAKGNIWGATSGGGSTPAPGGYGTLFVITPPAS